jgi:hypothetical protein
MNGFEEQGKDRLSGQSLEEQLSNALARCEPSADFTKGVLARVRELEGRRAQPWWMIVRNAFRAQSVRWAPALAAIILVAGGIVYQEHERTVEGLRAKQQLLEALRITNAKLRETGARVAQVETHF